MIPLKDDNPTRATPFVNYGLIAGCVLVFLFQLSVGAAGGQRLVYALGAIPAVLVGDKHLPDALYMVPPLATILTSMFLHGGWLHLFGNMLYLWIFGDNVEDAMGHVRFFLFYFLCGTAAVFAQALPAPDSQIPMIGASGAISGVLGAYILLFPHARVVVAIPIGFYAQLVRMPAMLILGLWFVLQLIESLIAPPGQAGVAFRAHIGGFILGMLLIPVFKRRDVPLWHRPARW